MDSCNMKAPHVLAALGFIAFLLCSGCATAQRGSIMRAQRGIDEGNYEFALRRLSEGESFSTPKPDVAAEIGYLKGVCYEGLHRPDEAKGMFQFVADHFPDTSYGYMAKEKLSRDRQP